MVGTYDIETNRSPGRRRGRPARSALLAIALLAGCNGGIYVRDGVTDGDTFYLAQRALVDADPVLQSWVAYSLGISTCQLMSGADNPARANSFDCEVEGRELLVDTWRDQKRLDPSLADSYLDDLDAIDRAGFLPEYVARNFGKRHWTLPADLDVAGYRRWARDAMPHHRPETHIIGSWNYARNAAAY